MPNNNMREIPKHDLRVNAQVEDRSLMKDLVKGAYNTVIVPQTKTVVRDMSSGIITMFADALRNLVDGWLYPDGSVPNRSSSQSSIGTYTGTTNYSSFSRPINSNNTQQASFLSQTQLGQRPGNEVKYIWVESEEKADKLIKQLKEDIDNYGKVKVATLYEIVGINTTMADFWYGWTDSSSLRYFYDSSRGPLENKWFIDLPRPIDIRSL